MHLPDNLFDGMEIDDSTETSTYQHIYKTNYDGTWKKHMCLQRNYWCWKQAFKRPDEAIKYLLNMLSIWRKK